MAAKSGNGRKDSAGPTATARVRAALGDRARLLHAAGTFIAVALVATVIGVLVAGHDELTARASTLRAADPRIEIHWPLAPLPAGAPADSPRSTWLDFESRASLERLVERQVGRNPLDPHALVATHDALLMTGWFDTDAGGVRVERTADGVVRVRGAWRRPVAAVRVGDIDHLVASDGVLLQPAYRRDGSQMRVIVGAAHPAPEFGRPWLGGDVQAGLALLDALRGIPGFSQVYGVDVSEMSTGRQLVIVTDLGNRIIWGGPLDGFSAGQAKATKKLQQLAGYHATFGRIDAGRAVVDIRSEAGGMIHVAEAALPRQRPSR
ncbi:MAG: hypothetical protein KF699_09265 [Phycisphaeraceae bacterium]|nr:hypothetical protein [Phycisphaeraceae bacterium]